jgi:arabinan endo-1,5-alpha-L-arabinosidase
VGYNALDPTLFIDGDDGSSGNQTWWLVFGSYWNGIQLAQVDPSTGKLLEGAQWHNLASR